MKTKFNFFSTSSLVLILILAGCSPEETNTPNQNPLPTPDVSSFETIDSDLLLLKEAGMDIDNEIFRPVHEDSETGGMVFAVAFGEPNDIQRFGINMGSVFINYGDHQIELHKRVDDRKGPFGCSDQLIEFIPNEEYQFEVTGSDGFSKISFSLISPSELIDITSHNNGDDIVSGQDLTVTWEGGDPNKKVAVRLIPFFRRHIDHHDNHYPIHDHIISVILDSNTGHYTFTGGTDVRHAVVGVSQMDFGEVDHENGVLRTAMRNGSNVMLKVK